MSIEKKLLAIRKIARIHGKYVMGKLFDDYLTGLISKKRIPSCSFCGNESNLTKEHILPRWVFENDPKHFFTSDVNELEQSYVGATIPLCSNCNSNLFNSLEREIQIILGRADLKNNFYSPDDLLLIIRWFEIIDFKFQVWDLRTDFKRHKKSQYIPFLAEFSIAFMRLYSVRIITTKARKSLKRIATKNKINRERSLIIGTTKEKTFHYFHTSGEFIYLEIPAYKKVFFYFYEREFKTELQARRAALKTIRFAYGID